MPIIAFFISCLLFRRCTFLAAPLLQYFALKRHLWITKTSKIIWISEVLHFYPFYCKPGGQHVISCHHTGRTWVPEVQYVPLKYVGETDVGVYRIHIEGDSLKTVAEDVVQTPVKVEVYRQTLEDTESGSRLQSPVEGA